MPGRAFAREFAALIDLQPEAQLLLDAQARILHLNPAAAALLGGSPGVLRNMPLQAHLDASGPPAEAIVRQGLRSSQPTPVRVLLQPAPGAATPRRLDGKVAALQADDPERRCLWLRLSEHAEGVHRFLALNQRLEASAREIARRQRVEEDLRTQRGWLEVVLKSIGDAVVACDLQGRVVFMNPVAEHLTAWTQAEALGHTVTDVIRLVDGPSGEPSPNPVLAVLRERRPFTIAEHTHLIRRDGLSVPIDDAATPIVDPDGRLHGAVLVFRDIGPRVRAEQERHALTEQLREAQKMEAIGRLAGGIAHDFNNVIAAILANTGMVRDSLAPEDGLQPLLVNVLSAGRRARELVQQILAFSRRQPRTLRAHVLQPVVHEAVALLRGALPARVQIVTRLVAEPVRVRIDATPFVQVLLNLCTNAWQAMRGSSGLITIGLDTVEIGDGETPAGAVPGMGDWLPGAYARLVVSDNGSGMDEATQARAFDPFFTTKPPGEGTGLGLAVVHGIVAEHHGRLVLRSRVGDGSTFTIYLPLLPPAGETVPAPLEPEPEAAPPVITGTVVAYVDDDEVMRLTAEALLRRAGYDVLVYGSARAALRALRDPALRCDALVTDYNMPRLSGLDLAAVLRRLRPELPVVISSGFLSPALIEGAAVVGATLMNKEESYERLAGLVAARLSERG